MVNCKKEGIVRNTLRVYAELVNGLKQRLRGEFLEA